MKKPILFHPDRGYYTRPTLRNCFWNGVLVLGIWISNIGDRLFSEAYARNDEDLLQALEESVPDDCLSPRQLDCQVNPEDYVEYLPGEKERA